METPNSRTVETSPRKLTSEQQDRAYLQQGKTVIKEMLLERETQKNPYKTILIPTTGGRIVSHFIRGLLDSHYSNPLNKPKIIYFHTNRENAGSELLRGLEQKRMDEIVKRSQPPYLVIDDYVTEKMSTLQYIEESLVARHINADDIGKFAFIAARTNQDKTELVDPNIYSKNNIRFGTLDVKDRSNGFAFNQEDVKLTEKGYFKKYEDFGFGQNYQAARRLRHLLYELGRTI
jgi:hypothetical protein